MTNLRERLSAMVERYESTGLGSMHVATVRRLLETEDITEPHDCPPGQLIRKYDGGNHAMLCPDCRRILGYDRDGAVGAMKVEWDSPNQEDA